MFERYFREEIIPAKPPEKWYESGRPEQRLRHVDVPTLARDLAIGAVGLAALLAFWPLRTVPTGSRGVVTVGGAIKGIESEGFTFIAPWQSLSIFNIRAESADVNNAEGATSDTQPVHINLTVRYSIGVDKVAEVYEKYSRDGDLSSYVLTATQESVKAVTAGFTAPELIAKRAQVSAAILAALRAKLTTYGAQVIAVDMRNFAFSDSYMKAINEKVTQEQLKLAADNKALTAASEQKIKIVTAEAEATALKARADGEAYATLKAATAQADALRVQNAALRENKDVLELRRIEVQLAQAQRWNGVLPTNIYAGAPVPFLNLTSSK